MHVGERWRSCEGTSGTPLVAETTLLEALTKQQSRGEKGVRLLFHSNLGQTFSLDKEPYFFCAMTGNTALAVFLYQNGIPKGHAVRIASFTADGTAGSTPWKKAIKVTAPVAARLAGHLATAEALDNVERGTPLHWTRHNAHQWPDSLKIKARPLVEALSKSPWFVTLPGSTRLRIVDNIVSQLACQMFWGRLGQDAWRQEWEQAIPSHLLQAATTLVVAPLSSLSKRSSVGEESEPQQYPSYQIRITGAQVPQPQAPRIRGLLRHIVRGAAGCLAVKVARHMGISRVLPEGVIVFALGCMFPAPVMMVAALLIEV